jgi:hypothetical protein
MYMRHVTPYVCAAVLWCGAQGLGHAAQSQLRLEVDNVDWRGGTRVGYDVFDPGEYPQTIYFKVRLTGDPGPFFVTFSRGASGTERRQAAFASNSLEYHMYDSITRRTELKDLPAANGNEVLQGAFGPRETVKELSYTILVPPQQVKPAGRYTDQFKITVYQGTLTTFVEKDARTVSFAVRMEEVTELALVESGAPFDPKAKTQKVDFGKLAKGNAKGFDMRVRSNAGYQVLLESEHGGVMQHTNPRITSTIPYVLQVGGSLVNLSGGRKSVLTRNKRVTNRDGDRHEMLVTIGEVGNAATGTYQDNITISVISDN